jgi:hypothetical protein
LERLTFSGRWFTIAFVLLLVLGVLFGVAAAIRFQKMLLALEGLRSTWPNAATVLEKRYGEVDAFFAKVAKEGSAVSADGQQVARWQSLRTEFKKSNQYDQQANWVAGLESLRRELVEAQATIPDDQAISHTENLASFLEADRAYESLQSDLLGKVCNALFRLKVPERIHTVLGE